MCFSARNPDPVAEVVYGPRAHRDGHLDDGIHVIDDQDNGLREEVALREEVIHGNDLVQEAVLRHGDIEMPVLEPEAPIVAQIVEPIVEENQVEENQDRILELRLIQAIEEIARENERLSTMIREIQQAIEHQTAILDRLYRERLDIDMNNNEGEDYGHQDNDDGDEESSSGPVDLSKPDKS